jgi:hypothetical protein
MAPTKEHEEDHDSAWELLPWYVNGSLNADEAVLVERHLAACPACRQEVERCRDLSVVAKSSGSAQQQDWAPSPRHFAQIMAQVDAAEAVSSTARPSLARKLRSWLIETPPPMRWAFAFQAGLIVALTGALFTLAPSDAPYETLSHGAESAAGEGIRLRLVFAEDTTEKELRDLLHDIDATIVGGPTPQGIYTVQLSGAVPERAQQISTQMARHPKVRFAAVVGSGGAQ